MFSYGCNWQCVSIGSDCALVSIRRLVIIWTNDNLVYWHIYSSPGLDEFNDKKPAVYSTGLFAVVTLTLTDWGGDKMNAIWLDDIFKCIFLNKSVFIFIKISLKFVPRGPIDKIPTLVQIMAWRRTGDKPLSEPMMAFVVDAYMHSASIS